MGFSSDSQRRAVFAILTQRLTGVKSGPWSKNPFSAEARFKRMARNKPRTAGVMYADAKRELRASLLNEAAYRHKRREVKKTRNTEAMKKRWASLGAKLRQAQAADASG